MRCIFATNLIAMWICMFDVAVKSAFCSLFLIYKSRYGIEMNRHTDGQWTVHSADFY